MTKRAKLAMPDRTEIRTRRAYFELPFGQLHVRTAFPATGGFDEQIPLFCVHPSDQSSRVFGRFLASIAGRRSVYAADLPGFGESDPSTPDLGTGAAALRYLARDLRLRRIDLLGVGDGSGVALDVAAADPQLVRRLVLIGANALDRMAAIAQPCLIWALGAPSADGRRRAHGLSANAEYLEAPEYGDNPLATAPDALAERIGAFLDRP